MAGNGSLSIRRLDTIHEGLDTVHEGVSTPGSRKEILMYKEKLISVQLTLNGMEIKCNDTQNELDEMKELYEQLKEYYEKVNLTIIKKLEDVTEKHEIAQQRILEMNIFMEKRLDSWKETVALTYKQKTNEKVLNARARAEKIRMIAALDDTDQRLSSAMEELSVTHKHMANAKKNLLILKKSWE
jgi:hypothetical protein